MAKKIGVLLSGCGVFDGAEIHETTLTLFYLDRGGVEVVCLAPDAPQLHVVDHQSSQEMDESRNILIESARLSRGNMKALSDINIQELDALILPGGFGAAKNLIDYAVKGRDCTIRDDVKNLILGFVQANKPVGAMCIAPMVLAVAMKDDGIKPVLTIGSDESTASDIEHFGAIHQNCPVDKIVEDASHKIVTTPAYMVGPGISDIAKGIEKLVHKVIDWA